EHVIAAKAVAFRIASSAEFRERQARALRGARILAGRLQADDAAECGVRVLTAGTEVHLVVVDLRASELDGRQAQDRLHSVGVTVTRNGGPFAPRPPMVSSGLRIGTAALATRGFDAGDFREVADVIAKALDPGIDASGMALLRQRVALLAERRPLYP